MSGLINFLNKLWLFSFKISLYKLVFVLVVSWSKCVSDQARLCKNWLVSRVRKSSGEQKWAQAKFEARYLS